MKHLFQVTCIIIAIHITIQASTRPTQLPARSASPTSVIADELIRTIIHNALQSEQPESERIIEASSHFLRPQRQLQATSHGRRPDSPWPQDGFERIL